MRYLQPILEKRMRKWWDILWALMFLFIILDWVLHQASHTWESILAFRGISISIIIGFVVLIQILKQQYSNEISGQTEAERKSDTR